MFFLCFFLGCKANARVYLAKTRHGPHSSNCCVVLFIVCFVSFYVFFVCKYVLYFCHPVTTQLQLTNIYHIFISIKVEQTHEILSSQNGVDER